MNTPILNTDIQKFITENLHTNVTKLILKGSPFKDVTVQELANQIIAKKKSEKKLPTWFSGDKIYYPAKLSIEQTSSEITAKYKASLVSGNLIIDITGGFGVDCFYFSKQFKTVIHCEINQELSDIVSYNFNQLEIKNTSFVSGDGIQYLEKTTIFFDCIYIDPSRRNEEKGKVFLLQDCLPNVPEHIDFLFSKTTQILIKNSPILDITSTIRELKFVKEIHVLAVNNEVKELLFLLEKNYLLPIHIKTSNILKNNTQVFNFKYQEIKHSETSEPLNYLYEPNAAILKAGGFHEIANKLGVYKIHKHSHLYTSENLIDFPGRSFKINHITSYDKKKTHKLIPSKKANITTRNFPKTVAQIRKETKLKDGGTDYIFCTTNIINQLTVLICSKV